MSERYYVFKRPVWARNAKGDFEPWAEPPQIRDKTLHTWEEAQGICAENNRPWHRIAAKLDVSAYRTRAKRNAADLTKSERRAIERYYTAPRWEFILA